MRKKILTIGSIFFIFVIAGFVVIKGDFIKSITLDASYPILRSIDTFSNFVGYVEEIFSSKDNLIQEKNKLEKENELLKAQIIYLKRLERENYQLKRQLNFVDNFPEFSFKVGKVIGYSPDNWNDFIIINMGSMDGVKQGDLVLSNGYLIGQIYQVGAYSSSVILVSDKNFKITGRCRKTREIVFFQGVNNKEGKLLYVKPQEDIRLGDIVETAGIEDNSLEGIPIGTISSISYEEGNFFKDVKVSLNINPYTLEYVVVVEKVKK